MVDAAALQALPDLNKPPKRVISLVPSLTESIITLGFGGSLIGITEYCIYPADQVAAIPRVGGTKNPDIEAIKALNPDLVMVNQEENTEETIAALHAASIPLWLSLQKKPDEAMDVLHDILAI